MIKVLERILPIKTVSVANLREHWTKKAARAAQQRAQAHMELRYSYSLPVLRDTATISVELTRCATRKLDDDNLRSAFKAVRDGIADYLQIDDGSARLTWSYAQELKNKANEIKLRLTIND